VETLLAIGVFGFVGYRMMSAEERERALRLLQRWAQRLVIQDTPASLAFGQALRDRTRLTLATPVLVATNVVLFVWMAMAPGPVALPETLIAWGGSSGPRTTNGEWWRLVTATFVHTGLLGLVANMTGLVRVAGVLERMVGPLAFVGVYLVAGIFATVISLASNPLDVTAGASGAVCGVYGLLLTAWIRGTFPRSALTIPFEVIKVAGPFAAAFVALNVLDAGVPLAGEAFGLFVGVAAGTALVRRVSEYKPPPSRMVATFATAVVIAVAATVPVRGIVDIRPELRAIVALEDRTVSTYQAAVTRYRAGRMSDQVLASVIEDRILPQFGTARKTLQAKGRVVRRDEPFIADAREYLRLREQSWRLRLDGLTGAGMAKLREAEARERSALEFIGRFRSS
jgi:membrane associated rhomboid family serine protease